MSKRPVVPKRLRKDEDLIQQVRLARYRASKSWNAEGSHTKKSWLEAAQRKAELNFMRQHRREKRKKRKTHSIHTLLHEPAAKPENLDARLDLEVVLARLDNTLGLFLRCVYLERMPVLEACKVACIHPETASRLLSTLAD